MYFSKIIGAAAQKVYNSLASTRLWMTRSVSTDASGLFSTDKTITIANSKLRTSPLLSLLPFNNVVKINIDNKLVPVKISDIVKKLGWTKEDVIAISKKDNAQEILSRAFEVKNLIDTLENNNNLPTQESNSLRSRASQAGISDNNHLIMILKLTLESLPKASTKDHDSLILTKHSLAVINPKTLEVTFLKKLGQGAQMAAFETTCGKVLKITQHDVLRVNSCSHLDVNEEHRLGAIVRENNPIFQGKKPTLQEVSVFMPDNDNTDGISMHANIEAKAETDLSNFIANNPNLSKELILSIQNDLAQDYANNFEPNNIAHTDSNLSNYLLYKDTSGHLRAAAADILGSPQIKPTNTTETLPTQLGFISGEQSGVASTKHFTPIKELAIYQQKAFEINKLIQSNGDTTLITQGKTECLNLLQKISMFQRGVAFYQIACKTCCPSGEEPRAENLPYELYDETSEESKNLTEELNRLNPESTIKFSTYRDIENSPKPPSEHKSTQVKENLENFYGKDDPKVSMILRMLDFDPEKRPTAKEVAEVFALPASPESARG